MQNAKVAIPAALAALPLVAAAVSTRAFAQSSDDLWNYDHGCEVLGHSDFDASFGDYPYDERDMFGGMFTDYEPERGRVIFTDGFGAGAVHWIEWRVPQPVSLRRIDAYMWGDAIGSDYRHTGELRVFARADSGGQWDLILRESQTRDEALGRKQWNVSHTFDLPVTGVQEFRAEFVQLSDSTIVGGPRIAELDGFGILEPCPADFNGDASVDTLDVLLFLNAWNARDPATDFNGDGHIDTRDFLAFLNAWVTGC